MNILHSLYYLSFVGFLSYFDMASTGSLGDFLAGVKASFAKYEEPLLEAGLEDIADLAELPADGVSSMAKEIGIPA